MDYLLNQRSIPSPGSLCLKAVFSKAVSGVRDCTSNTGDSDLKNTPGLLEAGEASMQAYAVVVREEGAEGGEVGDCSPKEDWFLSLRAE